MATEQRPWPNNMKGVLDNSSELIRHTISTLEEITTNQVNDEEKMEAIAAEAISDLTICLRALEKAGAATDPMHELESKVLNLKLSPASFVRV